MSQIHNIAFSKHTSTCFFVMSTFQLMCAYEAICEFEIADYKIIFAPWKEYKTRNLQMCDFADKLGLQYEFIYSDEVNLDEFYSKDKKYLTKEPKTYDRIFIGDYHSQECMALSVRFASKNALLVFTDDGVNSIALFNGLTKQSMLIKNLVGLIDYYKQRRVHNRNRQLFYKKLGEYDVIVMNSFYTIYYDIATRLYTHYPNKLNHVQKHFVQDESESKAIYIIGTVIGEYALRQGVSEEGFEAIVWKQLREITIGNEKKDILYIPHPRCNNNSIIKFCEALDIRYIRINEPVETYILSHGKPAAIHAFGSTSLSVLRPMYPALKIVNYYIDNRKINPYGKYYRKIREYYKIQGIENIEVSNLFGNNKNKYHLWADIGNTFVWGLRIFKNKMGL